MAEYIRKFPYQDTFNYAMRYTNGDPAKLNAWLFAAEPSLVKAGEDTVVRMNNDTFYNLAFLDLSNGPVRLSSNNPSTERFSSFQIMDDRNANFRNVIHPDGSYTLYFGDAPSESADEAISSPSSFVAVIVRVEVKIKMMLLMSITVYDTDRGGYLHPNDDNRYHINNTAAVKNDDGTVTFTFKQNCESADSNCLEVPAGRFDLLCRYYLPHEEIISGAWTFPGIELLAVGY